MKAARELLKELTKLFPPDDGCHHNITLIDEDRVQGGHLQVAIMQADKAGLFPTFLIDDEDYDKPVEELVTTIAVMMNQID